MPELTEVETVRRLLLPLRGARIERVASADARVFEAHADVQGRTVRAVERRGKWLRLVLDRGFVFSHLGMTGDWTLLAPGAAALPFERVRVDLATGKKRLSARYTDPRRFGHFVTSEDDIEAWSELGPDPLLDGIDEARVLAVMKKRKRPVKDVLLDQTLLAGVGNILAIETLWAAKLDPRTPARLMTAKDVHAIATSLKKLIERILDHREKTAKAGEYSMEPFRIYGHAGEPCPRDGVALRQIVQGGRGTTFCPGCQKRHVAPTRSRRA